METLRTKAKTRSAAKNASKATAGEVFPDGHLLELLADPADGSKLNLLHRDGKKAVVKNRVQHRGREYQAPALDSSILRASRFPTRVGARISTAELLKQIADLFKRYLNAPAPDAELLAFFTLSSWIADRLETAPGLSLTGPDINQGANALRILHCLCRRPLMLTEITPDAFRSLPMHLHPTLLINNSALTPRMGGLLRASCCRGFHVPGKKGGVLDIYCPKAIFCGTGTLGDIACDGFIRLSLACAQTPSPLSEVHLNRIADDWQPKLLTYRLINHAKVCSGVLEIPHFTSSTRELARGLGACIPDGPGLAKRLGTLLAPQDEDTRAQRCSDVNSAVIEVILAILHRHESRETSVKNITALTNTLLRSRGEILEYSPGEIGWKLAHLQVFTHRRSSGRVLLLSRETSRRVHRLARVYDVLSLKKNPQGCPDCKSVQSVST